MRKSLIALAVLSTFIGSAYAQTGSSSSSSPVSSAGSVTVSSVSPEADSTPAGQSGQNGVKVVSELVASVSEAACGCYSPPGSCP